MGSTTNFDRDREPELADIFDDGEPPDWVVEAATRALGTDEREAAAWADALSLALGRRANRMLRERIGPNPGDRA
jgi:hypothetical protein